MVVKRKIIQKIKKKIQRINLKKLKRKMKMKKR
jgi:hypothetical protein